MLGRTFLVAAGLFAVAGCKAPPIDENWARSVMLGHTAQFRLLEGQLDKALRDYAHAPEDAPDREKKLDADVEAALRDAKWLTGWAPVELVVEGDENASGARTVPFKPPHAVEGGSRRTPGVPIGATRRLYWGKFQGDGRAIGGIEVLLAPKTGIYTLNVHVFVVPGLARQEP
ncbi:MAG: hypothetical protein IRZ16_10795 [Myxococcaceae bacterium]|nr:hypothetical protein [Myxococcaceae bacterium]